MPRKKDAAPGPRNPVLLARGKTMLVTPGTECDECRRPILRRVAVEYLSAARGQVPLCLDCHGALSRRAEGGKDA